jgi:hypothetical protein
MLAFRTVQQSNHCAREELPYELKAASGRPPAAFRPGSHTTITGAPASPVRPGVRSLARPMDDRIQPRRDPEWRLAFEVELDDAARARIRRAIRNGSSVDDREQAAVAAGLARREQLRVLFLGLLLLQVQLAVAVVWVRLFMAGRVPTAFGWFWIAVLLVLVGVVPFVLRRRHHLAGHAAEANEWTARNSR